MSTAPTPAPPERGPGDWYSEALRQVRKIARNQEFFTSDDVWKAMHEAGAPAGDPRVMGAVMRTSARDDIAYRTGRYLNSSRRSCHARPIALWRSRIYRP